MNGFQATVKLLFHGRWSGPSSFEEAAPSEVRSPSSVPADGASADDSLLARPLPLAQCVESLPELPLIYFRTLNGYAFWPLSLPAEEEAPGIRRIFEVRSPAGEAQRCMVELPPSIRTLIHSTTQQEYPSPHALWGLVCRTALSRHLMEQASLPQGVLRVSGLNAGQLQAVQSMAGLASARAEGAGADRKPGAAR